MFLVRKLKFTQNETAYKTVSNLKKKYQKCLLTPLR